MYSADGKNKTHSGEGHAVSNIILFVVLFAIFLASIYALTFADLHDPAKAWWPFIACVAGGSLAFGIAKHVTGRADKNPDVTANEAGVLDAVDDEYRKAVSK